MAELITDKDGKITGLVSKWSRDDIIGEAKDHCNCGANPLTEDQVDDVLCELVDNFDAEKGICWDTIRCAIDSVLDL